MIAEQGARGDGIPRLRFDVRTIMKSTKEYLSTKSSVALWKLLESTIDSVPLLLLIFVIQAFFVPYNLEVKSKAVIALSLFVVASAVAHRSKLIVKELRERSEWNSNNASESTSEPATSADSPSPQG